MNKVAGHDGRWPAIGNYCRLLILWLCGVCVPLLSVADPSGFDSDDFNSASLDTGIWTFVDPVGDSSVNVNGTHLMLSVPAGGDHDLWTFGNNTARVMQGVNDVDFELEVKFETPVTQQYQIQGILIEQDASNFIRFDLFNEAGQTNIFAATLIGGSGNQRIKTVVSSGVPFYLRVTRSGNQWTLSHSLNGSSWTNAGSFSQALTVNSAGVFAGNSGGGGAPAHSAVVDYMFSTASPISPEDGNSIPDNTPPVIHNDERFVGQDDLQVTWATDEGATGVVEYGLTLSYELGSVEHTDDRFFHDLQITELTSNTTYHYRMRSIDSDGNEAVSGDYQVTLAPAPIIDVWYGPVQNFGQLGSNSARWVNILGNVSGQNPIVDLSYSLNGQASVALNMGPDDRRLQEAGDFNVDIEYLDLQNGANNVAITAMDSQGNETTENVTVNYSSGNTWPLPYSINWSSASKIEDVAQIVDGQWDLQGGGVRSLQNGYDRLISVGDITWDDYEFTIPITLQEPDPICFVDIASNPCNGGAAVGFVVRWQGHHPTSAQPNHVWVPLGALGWYRWKNNLSALVTNPALHLSGWNGATIEKDASRTFPNGSTQIFKMRAETVGNERVYKLKMWEQGTTEPSGWDLEGTQLASESYGNGSILLLAHYTDATFGDVSVVPLNAGPDTTPPVISNIQVSVTDTTATVTWDTDEAADSRVDYGLTSGYGSSESSSGLVTSHSLTLTGLSPDTLHHYQVTSVDGSGNSASSSDLTFTTNTSSGGGSPSGLESDHFDGGSLDPRWTFVDPVGDSTLSMTGSQASISVPAGSSHDIWQNENWAPRIRQSANNTDFELELKFDSAVASKFQLQGVMAEQDNDNLVRFDFYSSGNTTYIFAATMTNGSPLKRIRVSIVDGVPLYLKVNRQGNQWTESYSYDGVSWTQAGSFSHSLNVTSVAVYGGNAGSNPPAHTALVDYFMVDGLPPGGGGGDTTPPVISNIQAAVTDTTATITWDTNEVADSRVDYGLTSGYGSSESSGTLVTSHSLTLTGLTPDTLHHYQVTSVDGSGNSASSVDLTFTTDDTSDTTPPVISNVQVSVTDTSATVTWDTDEAADSTVDYGLTSSYGSIASDGSLVTSHSLTLTGLSADTQYHYQVTSEDGSGNSASSGDLTFTTSAAPDTTPPVISNVQVSVTDTTATVTWDTDEAADSRVDYGLTSGYGSSESSSGLVTSHSLTLTGLSPDTLHHYQVTSADGSGNSASSSDLTFTTNTSGGGGSPSGLESDNFNGGSLDPRWTFVDPVGDSTLSMTGSQASISVPAGSSHDIWQNENWAPRIRQSANNTDFELELKFDSAVASKFQLQGVMAEQDSDNLVRFDFYSNGNRTYIFAATMTAGSPLKRIRVSIVDGVPLYLKVNRQGDQWTESYSYDGVSWTESGSFSHSLTVSSVAVYGGNAGSNPPAHTALVDYFMVDGLPPGGGGGDTTPPVISNIQATVTDTTATITWDTNESADSRVDYGLTSGYGSNESSGSLVTSHSLTLTGLTADTEHHYQVTSVDGSGNSASSSDLTFTTSGAPDTTPPVISNIQVSVTDTTATITWDTDEAADSRVDYGLTSGYGSSESSGGLVTSHSVTLTGLTADTEHHYQVTSVDGSGNSASSSDLTFTTSGAPDTTPPVISNIQVSVTDTTATITWDTDEAADSRVDYGLTSGYGSNESSAALVTSHSLTLTGLTADTEHHYQVISVDGSGNSASSSDLTFTTSGAPDTTPPVISNIQVSVTDTTATITWDTDEAADSRVDYGLTSGYGSSESSAALVTSHSLTLTGLTADTEHHYQVTSVDGSGNSASSSDLTFTTNASGGSPSGLETDNFNSGSLDPRWTFVDPVGDSTLAMTGTQASISVPAGSSHDIWQNENWAPRIRQSANDADFELELKFDSAVTNKFQLQGVMAEQDSDNLVRFDFYSTGSVTKIFAAIMVNGVPTKRIRVTVSGSVPMYLRVSRQGDLWTESYSYDGVSWTEAGSFTHSLTVTSVAVYGGNAGNNPPAHTALIDYFVVDGNFN